MQTIRETMIDFQQKIETLIGHNEKIIEMLESGKMKTRVNGEDVSATELEKYKQMNISHRSLMADVARQISQLPL